MPLDVVHYIFSFLPLTDIMKTQLVCKNNEERYYRRIKEDIRTVEEKYPKQMLELLNKYEYNIHTLSEISSKVPISDYLIGVTRSYTDTHSVIIFVMTDCVGNIQKVLIFFDIKSNKFFIRTYPKITWLFSYLRESLDKLEYKMIENFLKRMK